jgi:hypothetical protein
MRVFVSSHACSRNPLGRLQVFTESKERLNGQDLDIFVVNRCSTSSDPKHCQQALVAFPA